MTATQFTNPEFSSNDRCLKLWYLGVSESRRGPVLDRILAQYLRGYHPNPPSRRGGAAPAAQIDIEPDGVRRPPLGQGQFRFKNCHDWNLRHIRGEL